MAQPDYRYTTTDIDVQFDSHGIRAWLSCVLDDGKMLLVASENSIHLTRSHRRIRTRPADDCNRPLVGPYAVRLLQAATAAGSRNPNTAASAQCPAAAHAVHGFRLHGTAAGSAIADLEDLPSQSYGGDCVD